MTEKDAGGVSSFRRVENIAVIKSMEWNVVLHGLPLSGRGDCRFAERQNTLERNHQHFGPILEVWIVENPFNGDQCTVSSELNRTCTGRLIRTLK